MSTVVTVPMLISRNSFITAKYVKLIDTHDIWTYDAKNSQRTAKRYNFSSMR